MKRSHIVILLVLGVGAIALFYLMSQGPSTAGANPGGTQGGTNVTGTIPAAVAASASASPNTGQPLASPFAANAGSGQASPNVTGSRFGGAAFTPVGPVATSTPPTTLYNNSIKNPSGNPITQANGQEQFTPIAGIPVATPPKAVTKPTGITPISLGVGATNLQRPPPASSNVVGGIVRPPVLGGTAAS